MSEESNRGPAPQNGNELASRFYDLALGEDEARLCRDIPEEQCREQPRNFLLQIIALALSKSGDSLADSKLVLPWLMGAVGAPPFLIGFLVPIRESLALLPQIFVGGTIRRFPVRKGFWVAGSLAQALCVTGMGLVAIAGLSGAVAGWTILGLLLLFSLARGVASIAAKDTLGKTVSKGRRGRVNGHSALVAGLVATAVGGYFAITPEGAQPDWLLYLALVGAGVFWFLAAITYSRIEEYPGASEGAKGLKDLVWEQVLLLVRDRELQKFLAARTLLIATALSGPVYVGLAQRETGQSLSGLGWLMIAAGLASSSSSFVWGILSDKSSRLTMALSAALAGLLGLGVLVSLYLFPELTQNIVFYAGVIFILGIAHAGVRIGRKTHIVDLASGDRKSEYVALSNTLIGVLLLVMGAVSALLLVWGFEITILLLSLAILLGAGMSMVMKHVQA